MNNIRLAITLVDQASAKARAIVGALQKLNTSVRTNVIIEGRDKLTGTLNKLLDSVRKRKPLSITMTADDKFTANANRAVDKFRRNLNLTSAFDAWTTKLKKAAIIIDGIVLGLTTAAGILGTVGLISLGKYVKQSIELNKQFEIYTIQLQTATGSLTAAKKEIKEIIQYAKQTPYTIEDVTAAVVRLRSYAMDPDKWLSPLGDMAAAFGREITNAVEAAADASQGQFRRMLEYGVRLEKSMFKTGGKYAGKTFAEAVLEEITTRFSGGMKLQSQTLKGLISNIQDTFTVALQQLGGPIFDELKKNTQKVYAFLSSDEFTTGLSRFIEEFATAFRKAKDALIPVITYIEANVLPTLTALTKTIFTVAGAVVNAFAGSSLLSPLKAITIEVFGIIRGFADVIAAAKPLVEIYVIFRTMYSVLNLVAVGLDKAAASMVALGQAATLTEASVIILGKRLIWLAALYAMLEIIASRRTLSENINAIGDSLEGLQGKIKKQDLEAYFNEIGHATNYTSDQIAEAARKATEFGRVGAVVLETAAQAARDMGKDLVTATAIIGEVSQSMITLEMSTTQAAEKVRETGDALAYINKHSQELKITQADVLAVLDKYPETLASVKNGWEDIIMTLQILSQTSENVRKDFYLFAETIELLKSPDADMLKYLDASIWIGKTTAELQNYSNVINSAKNETADYYKSLVAAGKAVQDILDGYADLTIENTHLTQVFSKQASYSIADIQQAYRMMANEVENLNDSLEYWSTVVEEQTDKLDSLEKELKDVSMALEEANADIQKFTDMQPIGTIAFKNAIADLEDEIRVLSLEKLYYDLDLLNDSFWQQEQAIRSLQSEITGMKSALKPLQDELANVKSRFDEVSDSISKAQQDLDKFTNPKLKGMEEFDDKIHAVEMDIKKLQRQRLDAVEKVSVFERLGLTGTEAYKAASAELSAIDRIIEQKTNQLDKLKLDRQLAYDDQLYQLEKIRDREKEITFEEAVAGATAAAEALDKLEPELENLKAEQDRLQNIVDTRQAEIDKLEDVVSLRQDELDAQRAIITNAQEELNLQIERLEVLQQILTTQREIELAGFNRRKENLLNPITEGSPEEILTGLENAINKASMLESMKKDLETQITTAQDIKENAEAQIGEIESVKSTIDTYMKGILQNIPSFIEAIDVTKFAETDAELLSTLFGEDIKTVIGTINTNIDNIKQNIETLVQNGGIPPAGADQGERSFLGDIGNWLKNTTLGNIVSGVGLVGGGFLLKKKLPGFVKKLGGTATTTTGGMMEEVAQAGRGIEAAEIASAKAAQIAKIESALDKQIDNVIVTMIENGKTDEEILAALDDLLKTPTNKKLLQTLDQLHGENVLDKMLARQYNKVGVARQAVQEVVEQTGKTNPVQKAINRVLGGVPGVQSAEDAAGGLRKLLSGEGSVLTNLRTVLYNVAETLGWGKTLVGGETAPVLERVGRVGVGQQIQKKLFPKLKLPFGGQSGAVSAGGLFGGGGLLGIGLMGLLGGALGNEGEGFNWGTAAETAAFGASYMGLEKLGTMGLAKVAGAGVGKLIPGLGWAALAGDMLRLGEGLTGTRFGAVGKETVTKVGGGFNDLMDKLGMPYMKLNNLDKLSTGVENSMNGITDSLGSTADVVNGIVGSAVGLGKGLFTGDWSYLKESANQIKTGAFELPKNVAKAAGNTVVTLANAGEEIFDKTTQPFQKGYDWLRTHFKPVRVLDEKVLTPMKTWLRSKYAGVKDFLTDPFGKAQAWFEQQGGLSGIKDKVIGWFKGIPEWFSGENGLWSKLSGAISGPFSSAWEWLTGDNGPKGWWNKITEWFSGIANWFSQELWPSIKSKVVQPFIDAWNWLIGEEGPKSWWGKVTSWFSDIANWFTQELWPSIKTKITKPFIDAWDWITNDPNGPSKWGDKIAAFFTSIPQKIGAAATSIYNAGKDFVANLVSGIRAKWEEIREQPGIKQIFDALDFIRGYDRRAEQVDSNYQAVHGFASGGVVNIPAGKEMLARLHGHEAIIPLQQGAVPVEFVGQPSATSTVVVNNNNTFSEGAFNFIVRDDEDIEEIKKFIIKIMQNQHTFQDKAYNYTARY